MRRYALFPVILLFCACSDTSDPAPVDLAGRWSVSFLTSGVNVAGYSCAGTAALDLARSGERLSGSYAFDATCTTPHDRRADEPSGTITVGSVSGSSVRFETGECTFEGVALSSERMSGTVRCNRQAGIDIPFAGNWEAVRS